MNQSLVSQHFRIRQNKAGACAQFFEARFALVGALSAAENNGVEFCLLEPAHLIVHKRQKRIDNKSRPVQKQGGHHKAQGLSRSRRQKNDLTAALGLFGVFQNICDNHALPRIQIGYAENFLRRIGNRIVGLKACIKTGFNARFKGVCRMCRTAIFAAFGFRAQVFRRHCRFCRKRYRLPCFGF